MPIAFTRYVDITSGVAGAAVVATRELIGRIFTTNELLPPQSYLEFTSATAVGVYFGTTSEEYKRAVFYFSFISKKITAPRKISFARWTVTDVAPMIFGGRFTTTLSAFQLITAGAFSLTMGSSTFVVSALDFSAAVSLAGVATLIQTGIQAKTGGGSQWTSATVAYNATNNSFDLIGGSDAAAVLSVASPGTGTDITTMMGWTLASGAIWSNGSLEETVTDTLTVSAGASDNFGSFLFQDQLTADEAVEAATWNSAENVKYQFCIAVAPSTYAAYSTALIDIRGTGITQNLTTLTDEYPEMAPMLQMAATNYTRQNSVVNYEFQQYTLTPTVSDDTTADTLDAARVNYYGVTQSAGQLVAFYQTGVLCGGENDPLYMNIYANEQWFKAEAGAALMNLLLVVTRIPFNNQGRAQIITILQGVIALAKLNGTISVGKELTTLQKLKVEELTGDPLAWYAVQNIGYVLDVQMVSYVVSSVTKYKAVYTLVYSKDDVISKIEGFDILI